MLIPVKKLFTSRYPNGSIIQFDYSQLELRVLSYLSQDVVLMERIISGADLHTMHAIAWKKRDDITKEERTAAKAMSFQLAYGSGANNMSLILEIPLEEAKAFIKSFYETYPQVKEWHDKILEEANANRELDYGFLRNPAGRILAFKEYPSPDFMQDRGIMFSLKPQQIKNYPCQSTAADILIIQRGRLMRKLLPFRDDCCIVNTVHDSVILDCKTEIKDNIIQITKETLEDLSVINKIFDKELNVPLTVDVNYGPSWGDLND